MNRALLKNKIGVILFCLLCLSAITGYYTYFVATPLAFIRILPILIFGFVLFLPKTDYDKTYFYTVGFFFVYAAYTAFISVFYADFIQLLDVLNYVLAFLIVFVSLTLIYTDAQKYLHYFFLICIGLSVGLSCMAIVEFATGWHLPASFSSLPENVGTNFLCAFFANPNDLAVVLSLLFIYVLAYHANLGKKWPWYAQTIYMVLILSVLLLLRCRTAEMAVGIFLLYYFRNFIKRHKFVWLIGLLAVILVGGYLWFLGTDSSTNLRLNLYKYSFASLYDSYCLGFGARMERYYFASLNNYNLFHGITNTHSFLLEMLISSGIVVFILYVLLLGYIEKHTIKIAINEFCWIPVLYVVLLFAPSSSVDLWWHYIFFAVCAGYVHYGEQTKVSLNAKA